MLEIREVRAVTNENVDETYEYIFAPWVKALGLQMRQTHEIASVTL